MSGVAAAARRTVDRIDAVDLLRGLVMIVMVLDHTRDFIHADALRFDPTDLSRTTPLLFLTRWITHFCAPIFVLLAGVSARLVKARGRTTGELSRFLLVRGCWLIVLELTVIRATVWFNLDFSFLGILQVIWAIGVSMIVLAALIHLPLPAIGAFGIGMIALHNAFDGVRVAGWQGPGSPLPDAWGQLWIYLHQTGEVLPLFGVGPVVAVMYPLVPWIGVIAAGYALGALYELEAERRQRLLERLGGSLCVGFILLRALNVYGDPAPWRPQAEGLLTILSFFNVTKYPPSLLYLMVTLGPALLALSAFESRPLRGAVTRAVVTFGRVPLFFYLLQWPLVHLMAIALTVATGRETGYLFQYPPAFYSMAPPDAGFPLWVVYVCWAVAIAILFVLCRWFAGIKARRRDWWLGYL